MISLRKNILSSYAAQMYVTIIGIVMLPLYLRYMGEETYGLVGFFASLQATFQLFDLGMTPTIARETARAADMEGNGLRRLLHSFEKVFAIISVGGAVTVALFAQQVADHWLRFSQLSTLEVLFALKLMGVIVGLRFVSGLYRGAITGFESLVWLSGFTALITTLRFVAVFPLFILLDASPTTFFFYQLVVAVIEVFGLIWKTYSLLPEKCSARPIVSETPRSGALKFSATFAFTSGVWILITQVDKIALSKILSLREFAYFTLAIVVAGGITILGGPLSSALLPRLTRLAKESTDRDLLALYKSGTQVASVVCFSAAVVLAIFSHKVLMIWTGKISLADNAAHILSLYAIGNGFLAVGAFPYYLQFAKGDLKLHVIGNCIFLLVLIPSIIFAAMYFGAIGTGVVWAAMNILYFLLWAPLVHRRLAPGLHWDWLTRDVAYPAILVVLLAGAAKLLLPWSGVRALDAIQLLLIGLCCLVGASMLNRNLRAMIFGVTGRLFDKYCEY